MRSTSLSLFASIVASLSLLACAVDDARLGKGSGSIGQDTTKTQTEAAGGSSSKDPKGDLGSTTGGSKGEPTTTGAGGASQACDLDDDCGAGFVCVDQVCQSDAAAAGGSSPAEGGHTSTVGGSSAQGGQTTTGTGGSKAEGGHASTVGGSSAEGGHTNAAGGSKAEGGQTSTGTGGATQACTSSDQCQPGTWCLYGACVPFEGEEGGTDGSGGTGAGGAKLTCEKDTDCPTNFVCFAKECFEASSP